MTSASNTPSVRHSATPLVDALTKGIKAQADLRQAVWEASQFHSLAHIREYVDAVLREIESDEP